MLMKLRFVIENIVLCLDYKCVVVCIDIYIKNSIGEMIK